MRRYELSDQQWARIAPLFPQHPKAGRPPKDHRSFVDGILWILHTGAPWRDLPEHYGPWQTVFYRFNGWRRDGTWVRIVTSLLDELDDRATRPRPVVHRRLRHPGRWAAAGGKKGRQGRRLGRKRRKCRSRLTMRWGGREVVLARKSIWHVKNTASSLPSTSHPARHTRAKHLNRRWPDGCFTAAGVRDVGRASWRG